MVAQQCPNPHCREFLPKSGSHSCKTPVGALAPTAPVAVQKGQRGVDIRGAVGDPIESAYASFQRLQTTQEHPDLATGVDVGAITKYYGKGPDNQKARTAAILGELETGVANLSNSDNFKAYLDMCSRFHKYSFNNTLLIAIQKPEATQVAGFRKWQEMGRTVKKGEKGIAILFPKKIYGTLRDKDGQPVLDDKGKPKKGVVATRFGVTSVFDVSQTEGEPLPESPTRRLVGGAPEGFQEKLEQAIAAKGFTVSHEEIPFGQANGYTDHENKRVVINKNLSPAQRAKTTAHELGHVLAHGDKDMSEYHNGRGGCRGQMEVEAEGISYILCQAEGMDTSGYSFGYVTEWGGTQSADGDTAVAAIRSSADTITKHAQEAFSLLEGDTASSDEMLTEGG